MTKLFALLFATAFVIGLSAAPILSYAQDDAMEDAEEGTMESGDDSSTMEENSKDEASPEDPIEESEDSE